MRVRWNDIPVRRDEIRSGSDCEVMRAFESSATEHPELAQCPQDDLDRQGDLRHAQRGRFRRA
jgi:hypothetical protein